MLYINWSDLTTSYKAGQMSTTSAASLNQPGWLAATSLPLSPPDTTTSHFNSVNNKYNQHSYTLGTSPLHQPCLASWKTSQNIAYHTRYATVTGGILKPSKTMTHPEIPSELLHC